MSFNSEFYAQNRVNGGSTTLYLVFILVAVAVSIGGGMLAHASD